MAKLRPTTKRAMRTRSKEKRAREKKKSITNHVCYQNLSNLHESSVMMMIRILHVCGVLRHCTKSASCIPNREHGTERMERVPCVLTISATQKQHVQDYRFASIHHHHHGRRQRAKSFRNFEGRFLI